MMSPKNIPVPVLTLVVKHGLLENAPYLFRGFSQLETSI